MASIAIDINDIESLKNEVIHELDQHTLRPIELLRALGENHPDDRIKEAVLRLLQEGRIELTADRVLRVSGEEI